MKVYYNYHSWIVVYLQPLGQIIEMKRAETEEWQYTGVTSWNGKTLRWKRKKLITWVQRRILKSYRQKYLWSILKTALTPKISFAWNLQNLVAGVFDARVTERFYWTFVTIFKCYKYRDLTPPDFYVWGKLKAMCTSC